MRFLTDLLNKLRKQPEQAATYGTVNPNNQHSSLLPPSHKKQQMAALQSGYDEMLDLSRSIRDHLDSQQELQVKIGETLDQVPEAVGHLRQICRNADRQSEAISNLVESTCTTQEMLHKLVLRSERRMMLALTLFILVMLTAVGGGVYLALPRFKQAQPAPTETAPVELKKPAIIAEPIIEMEPICSELEEIDKLVEAEMVKIAELIDEVILNFEDEAVLAGVKTKVHALVKDFPLYK